MRPGQSRQSRQEQVNDPSATSSAFLPPISAGNTGGNVSQWPARSTASTSSTNRRAVGSLPAPPRPDATAQTSHPPPHTARTAATQINKLRTQTGGTDASNLHSDVFPKAPKQQPGTRNELDSRSTDRSVVLHDPSKNAAVDPFNATLGSQVSMLGGMKTGGGANGRETAMMSRGKVSMSGEAPQRQPPLVVELEGYIRKEIALMQKNGGGPRERLSIFSEAFSNLASHFREYTELFMTIKREYEEAIQRGIKAQMENVHLLRELDTAKQCVQYIIDAETQKLDSVIRQLKLDVDERNKELAKAREQMTDLIKDKVRLENTLVEKNQEIEDVTSRCKLATDALRNETERHSEMHLSVKQFRKDNEKLQKYSSALEERVQADQVAYDALQAQVNHLRFQMQNLIQQNQQMSEVLSQEDRMMESSIRRSNVRNTTSSSGGIVELVGSPTGSPRANKTGRLSPRNASVRIEVNETSDPAADSLVALEKSLTSAVGGNFTALVAEATPEELEDALIRARGQIKALKATQEEDRRKLKVQTAQLTDLKRKRADRPSTPRPDWSSISDVLPDFNPIAGEQSTIAIVDDLADQIRDLVSEIRRADEVKAMKKSVFEWLGEHQITEGDMVQKKPKFIGLGNSPDVPVFLRFHGRIRNKRMHKGEVERLLSEFWEDRQKRRRAEGKDVQPLNDFFFEFLYEKTKSNNAAIELAYNMIDVCKRNMQDPDCAMFVQIMDGQVSEERLFDEIATVDQLRRIFEHEDKASTGFLPRSSIHFSLRQFFPAKTHDNLLKLKFALLPFTKTEEQDQPVHYSALFSEDSSGNQSRFVELIRQQHGEESEEFLIDIGEVLRAEISPTGFLQMSKIINTIKFLDPKLPLGDVRKILAKGMNISPEQVEKTPEMTMVLGEEFLKRIRLGVFVKRYSKPPKQQNTMDSDMDDGEDDNNDDMMSESSFNPNASVTNFDE